MNLRNYLLLMVSVLGLTVLEVTDGYKSYFMEQDCKSGNLSIQLDEEGALLRATKRTSYYMAMNCEIFISAPDNYVIVSVREIGFRLNDDGTCKDYLQIIRPMCARQNFKNEEHHYFSNEDGVIELLYHVSKDNTTFDQPGFQITASAFTKSVNGECNEERYPCENGHCIWKGLKCDSHNNCGDMSDEANCGGGSSSSGGGTTALIILGILILLLLIIMCIATLLCSKNENIRRIRTRTMSYLRRFSN